MGEGANQRWTLLSLVTRERGGKDGTGYRVPCTGEDGRWSNLSPSDIRPTWALCRTLGTNVGSGRVSICSSTLGKNWVLMAVRTSVNQWIVLPDQA